MRIYVKHFENSSHEINQNVQEILKKEKDFGLTNITTYTNFSEKVQIVKKKLLDFVKKAKSESKTIVCYGAPAKGNTLLNFCGLNSSHIDYTVDLNPEKQGLYLPGSHIPVKSPEKIKKTKPDYLLILPWNLKDEVVSQMSFIRSWGGKFVVPIPEVKIFP